jgi:hypothetical protein
VYVCVCALTWRVNVAFFCKNTCSLLRMPQYPKPYCMHTSVHSCGGGEGRGGGGGGGQGGGGALLLILLLISNDIVEGPRAPAVKPYCMHTSIHFCECMHVCTYVCMYHTYVCIIRMYVSYVCMYVRMYIHTYVCMHACMHLCTCISGEYRKLVCLNPQP